MFWDFQVVVVFKISDGGGFFHFSLFCGCGAEFGRRVLFGMWAKMPRGALLVWAVVRDEVFGLLRDLMVLQEF